MRPRSRRSAGLIRAVANRIVLGNRAAIPGMPAEDDAENVDTAQVYLLIGHFSPEPPKVQN